MNANGIFNVIGAVLTIALVTTIVARPNSVQVIRAAGDSLAKNISAALGAGVRF